MTLLEKTTSASASLDALLGAPEPGLFSWVAAVRRVLLELAATLPADDLRRLADEATAEQNKAAHAGVASVLEDW